MFKISHGPKKQSGKMGYLATEHVAGRLEEVDNLSDEGSGGGVLQLLEGLTRPPQDRHHNIPPPGLGILVQHHLPKELGRLPVGA